MAARATWKGLLRFGLVTIPVKMYPATTSSESLAFHQLHAGCQSRLQQKKWCPICARDVPAEEILKGFEFEKGRYVVLLPAELDAVQPPSTRVIDLVQFAEASALEHRAIDRAYALVPDGADDGPIAYAYAVFRAALHGRVGLGKLAIYGREYLVAVAVGREAVLLYTLHHAAEQRSIAIPPVAAMLATEVALTRQLIDALVGPLNLTAFTDDYRADLQRLIDAKIAGEEIVVAPIAKAPLLTLREALTQSLAAVSAAKASPGAKRKTAR